MSCHCNKNKISILSSFDLKAFFFDMDGVLFDSMPYHAKAWVYAFKQMGVDFDEYEAYMREGMTGAGTINEIYQLKLGRNATEKECQQIYKTRKAAAKHCRRRNREETSYNRYFAVGKRRRIGDFRRYRFRTTVVD